MYVIDSRDTLSFAREHAARLKDDAPWDQGISARRRTLATWLRRHGCRCKIETAPLAHHSA
jgi:hypothetical protein